MRKIVQAALVALLVALPAVSYAQPAVTARGAIIVDAETGSVIWERNADEPLPPASTTKVMTAVLALQSHRLDEQFPVTVNASNTPPSKIGLRPGQRVSLHDLLFAVLLKSANDAAVVVAEGVSGSEMGFAQQMNLKARVIGAVSTNFENPHGLTEGGHLTTARDLSRIFRYGLGVPGFREVLYTSSAGVEIDGPSGRYTTVRSHNRLLNAPDYKVIGKTGYTRAARRCYVGAAGYGSREVVIALLGSTDLWGDARRMLYYGLQPGRPTPVLTAARTPPPPAAAPIALAARTQDVQAPPAPAYRPAPQPEYRAPAPQAEYRAAPQPEYRAVPPPPSRAVPPPAPTPAELARTDANLAPQAAVDRAARMARAQPDAAPAAPETVYDQAPPGEPSRDADGFDRPATQDESRRAPDRETAAPAGRAYEPAGGRREIVVDEDPVPGSAAADAEPDTARPTRRRAAATVGAAAAVGATAGRRTAPATRDREGAAPRNAATQRERPAPRDAKSRTASTRSTTARQKPVEEAARARNETRTTAPARKDRDTGRTNKPRATDAARSTTDTRTGKRDQDAARGAPARAGKTTAATTRPEVAKRGAAAKPEATKAATSRKEADKVASQSRVSGQKPTTTKKR